jgi:hypothetical protein
MARRKKNDNGRVGSKGQRWLNTSLSENVNSLTTTVTALELDSRICLLRTSDDFDIPNDDNSLIDDSPSLSQLANPNAFFSNITETDEEFASEETPVNVTATVAQQLQIHLGTNNTSVSDDELDNPNSNSNDESHVSLSPMDCATLDVLKLCHDGGCSLEFYDNLFALLRRHSTKNKVDVTKLPKRETFLKSLRSRISSPMPIISQVGNLQVPHFDILSQIRDLLGSFIFNDLDNLCVNTDPEERYNVFVPTDDDKFVEMCAQKWYKETYAEFVTNPEKQFLLPLIFYIDETGTDVFQRYPLEPLMFTFGILRNSIRERSSSWRHAGFIPKVAKAKTSCESLQLYHDCMAMVLSTLKTIQDDPPLEWLQFGDDPAVQKELIIQVCFMMGDQKSQDNLTGRKLNNSGWAGRSHRGCMCSGPSSSDPCLRCQPVPVEIIHELRDISFTSDSDSPSMEAIIDTFPLTPHGRPTKNAKAAQDFVKRRAGLARDILGDVFTMHPLHNAWNSISFGANKNGIYGATLDDPMHFNESGLFDGVTKAFYGCFTEEELKKFEETTRSLYLNSRSSVRSEYPKSRVSKGFTSCTLKTANETVGSLVSVVLTVQENKVFDLMDQVGKRQQQRYLTFPVSHSSTPTALTKRKKETNRVSDKRSKLEATDLVLLDHFPSRRNYTFGRDRTNDAKKEDFPRTNKSCRLIFKHLKKHGLGFLLDLDLDEIQMEYLLVVCWKAFAGIDFSWKFYPENCLKSVLPVFPFPETVTNKRMEEYYRGHLHGKETLRSTIRGGAVKLSQEDIINHTSYHDEIEDSDDEHNSEEEKPRKRQKVKQTQKRTVTPKGKNKAPSTGQITTTISFPGLRSSKGVKKHGRIKPYTKGTGSTSAVLCGVKPYVQFIELALCLHAYLHYSKDLTLETRCKPEIFDRGVREFLRLFNAYVYRGDDSVDTDTCKIHCHLHILGNILNFGDPMQYDAAKGERGLKDWAKQISQTAQKCGIDIFLYQTIHRVATYQLMQRAEQVEQWRKHREDLFMLETATETKEAPVRPVMNRKVPHFRYKTLSKDLYSVDRRGRETLATKKTGLVDQRILSKIERDHSDLEVIDIWGEIYLTNSTNDVGQLLRGHPTFDRYGEMFDWAAVTFDTEDSNEGLVGPAKILAFYKDGEGVERAVVHATNVTTGRETKAGNTLLIQNVRLEFNTRGHPALRTIRVDQIDRGIMAFEHENFDGPLPPNINYATDKSKYVVSCFDDRTNWAYLFYDWANSLPESDTITTRPDTDEDCETDTESEQSCPVSSSDDDST